MVTDKKLEELVENEDFMLHLRSMETYEDAVKLFAEYGVEITTEELQAALADVPEGELDEAALRNVVGGVDWRRVWRFIRDTLIF